jgi:predicted GNAT family acetyltransferase
MNVERFGEVRVFYDQVEAYLLQHEAHHNLIFGLAARLMEQPEYAAQPPYFACVRSQGAVVAAALMTPPHGLVLSLATVPDALRALVEDVRAFRPDLPGVLAPVDEGAAFASLWQANTGRAFEEGRAQRIYQLEQVIAPPRPSGRMRPATHDDYELLVDWFLAFSAEVGDHGDREGAARSIALRLQSSTTGTYLWEDGAPVALAGCGGPTPNGIRIGPVYTPPEHRRRGYASTLVAELSQLVLGQGRRYCFLFTDRSNPTANHIYQEIGYRPVCDVNEYRFAPA